MVKLPDEVVKLIREAKAKYPDKPIGFNYDEWDSFEDFKKYLKKLIEEEN